MSQPVLALLWLAILRVVDTSGSCDPWDKSDEQGYRRRMTCLAVSRRVLRRLAPVTAIAALGVTTLAPAGLVAPAAGAGPTLASSPAPLAAARAVAPRRIDHQSWSTPQQLGAGRSAGTAVVDDRLVLAPSAGRRQAAGSAWVKGRWTSPWVAPGFGLTELLPSWNARTPGNSRLRIRVQARTTGAGSWDVIADWAASDRFFSRRTRGAQGDDLGKVNVDTWQANQTAGVSEWRIQVVLKQRRGTRSASPSVSRVGATASRLPSVTSVATSTPGPGRGVVLDVPRFSQMIHRGHSPKWGGGGQAWCSPTSTSMVLGHYRALPRPKAYAWVGAGHPNPWVDHAARMTYDTSYGGAGNWPFNTAYAATRVDTAFVTRLRSLREAEGFVVAGIPLVVSISFASGRLSGAPISATAGHLVVIVGFTDSGDVIVNDPAAPSNASVRRTYDRGQFENAWLPKSGGLTYVIHDAAHDVPARGNKTNW